MISGVIIRIKAASGWESHPPGSLAACLAAVDGAGEPRALFVFENGEGRALTWAEFHSIGSVVGFADWLHEVLTSTAVESMSADTRRRVLRDLFHQNWPIAQRRISPN